MNRIAKLELAYIVLKQLTRIVNNPKKSIMKKKDICISGVTVIFLVIFFHLSSNLWAQSSQTPRKKVYMSYILHGNMNYDRYVKSQIWDEFPEIYDNLLNFIEAHPEFKGQLQLSGQTFKSLQQTAPNVIDHAMKLYDRGQINFTGTFYSEPVNVSMDGETNLTCARLGTEIIARELAPTDGFYLQERAYHPQLPWILEESNVSWVPVITGDSSYFPFRLAGMDGSSTICVPNISRRDFPDILNTVPEGCLLTIEGDYEIPQSFGYFYNRLNDFLKENEHIEVEWITVKEYIEKFGVKEEKYIDHTAVAQHTNHGTYSRWTADPLDIILQDHTNHAMSDFRSANMVNALARYLFQTDLDMTLESSMIELKHDPLVWDIASTEDYLDVEKAYLNRNGQLTLLSKAEHLLVWAVNSDSRGWYPLYEKRRERINSLENCSLLARNVINKGLDLLTETVEVSGFDKYYLLFNSRPAREKIVQIETERPFEVFDMAGNKLRQTIRSLGDRYVIDYKAELPSYGYTVVGLRATKHLDQFAWETGSEIGNEDIQVKAEENRVVFICKGKELGFSMDDFILKPLAEMSLGVGDSLWRKAVPFGDARVSVREGLYPQLRIEKQIDWLVHIQQIFTLLPDRVLCKVDFDFPHPTVLRETESKENSLSAFHPGGLNLRFKVEQPGSVFYNIPFGTSPHLLNEQSYFCTLHSGIFQQEQGGGFMITAGTGEQAFFTNPSAGEMGFYAGASTASGPIRKVGMEIVSDIRVEHEPAWYLEPFHGFYEHAFMLFPFEGNWQESQVIREARAYLEPIYMREFVPNKSASEPACRSLVEMEANGVEITSMEYREGEMQLRLNDKENKKSKVAIRIGTKKQKTQVPKNGIVTLKF